MLPRCSHTLGTVLLGTILRGTIPLGTILLGTIQTLLLGVDRAAVWRRDRLLLELQVWAYVRYRSVGRLGNPRLGNPRVPHQLDVAGVELGRAWSEEGHRCRRHQEYVTCPA
jgi:hypothetical protein